MSLLKWLNPLNWGTLAIQIVGVVLLVCGLGWYANYKLEKHYTKAQAEAVKLAQDQATAKQVAREAANLKRTNEALDAQTKTLAKNLADANAAAASATGLRDAIRASEDRAKSDLSACLQHARSVGELLETGTELAGRIAKEADGHVADKVACHAAWPK